MLSKLYCRRARAMVCNSNEMVACAACIYVYDVAGGTWTGLSTLTYVVCCPESLIEKVEIDTGIFRLTIALSYYSLVTVVTVLLV